MLVLEYGIDHPGDMDVLLDIAIPHMSMLTAVDSVHASYFADKEAIFTEKVKLLLKTREVAFRSADLEPWMKQIELSCDGLTFALHEDENQTNV